MKQTMYKKHLGSHYLACGGTRNNEYNGMHYCLRTTTTMNLQKVVKKLTFSLVMGKIHVVPQHLLSALYSPYDNILGD